MYDHIAQPAEPRGRCISRRLRPVAARCCALRGSSLWLASQAGAAGRRCPAWRARRHCCAAPRCWTSPHCAAWWTNSKSSWRSRWSLAAAAPRLTITRHLSLLGQALDNPDRTYAACCATADPRHKQLVQRYSRCCRAAQALPWLQENGSEVDYPCQHLRRRMPTDAAAAKPGLAQQARQSTLRPVLHCGGCGLLKSRSLRYRTKTGPTMRPVGPLRSQSDL